MIKIDYDGVEFEKTRAENYVEYVGDGSPRWGVPATGPEMADMLYMLEHNNKPISIDWLREGAIKKVADCNYIHALYQRLFFDYVNTTDKVKLKKIEAAISEFRYYYYNSRYGGNYFTKFTRGEKTVYLTPENYKTIINKNELN